MEDPRFTFFQKLAERIEDQMLSQMPAWNVPGETPEEGEWPARDAVPYVATSVATQDQDCAKVVRDAAYWRSSSDAGRLPGSREVEVTAEMVAAGVAAMFSFDYDVETREVIGTYRAMAALAPVPLVSDGELAAVREMDVLNASLREGIQHPRDVAGKFGHLIWWPDELPVPVFDGPDGGRRLREVARLQKHVVALHDEIESLQANHVAHVTALRAELARAHDLLAQRPAPVPDTPRPAVVIREHRSDRRRMGPA